MSQFVRMYTFHAQAGYSYFSADCRLKNVSCTFLCLSAKYIYKNGYDQELSYEIELSSVCIGVTLHCFTRFTLYILVFIVLLASVVLHSAVQIYEFHIFIISSSPFPGILRTNLMTSSQLAC